MSEVELIHWLRVAAARGGFAAAGKADELLQQFSEKPRGRERRIEVGLRPLPS